MQPRLSDGSQRDQPLFAGLEAYAREPPSYYDASESKLSLLPGGPAGSTVPMPRHPSRVLKIAMLAFFSGVCAAALVVFVCTILYSPGDRPALASLRDSCPAFAYDSGAWVKKVDANDSIANYADLLAVAGYKGCRGRSENGWEWFGSGLPDYSAQAKPLSYEWRPHEKCHLRQPSELAKIQMLVDGPLLLLGDSLQRQLFYQLSCELFEHVTWSGIPDPEAKNVYQMWRVNNQYLYLDPKSPLIDDIQLPRGFNFSVPIISYVAFWLPQSFEEIIRAVGSEFPWMSAPSAEYGRTIDKPMKTSLDVLRDPSYRIKTAVFTVGAHYSTGNLFAKAPAPDEVLRVARWSMRKYLEGARAAMRFDQKFMVRAAPPGLLVDKSERAPYGEVAHPPAWWNWQSMRDLSRILEDETRLLMDQRFQWLGGDRPASMRPDGRHPDGMHYIMGAGILESVSRYMWHQMSAVI